MACYSSPIEKLPEDIQLRILLSLPLVDAVATRPLSRRWNNLWEKSCSHHLNLCFDVDNIFSAGVLYRNCRKEDTRIIFRKSIRLWDKIYQGVSSEIIEDFIKGVDMIVQHRSGKHQDALLGVNSLEIRFPLGVKHSNHLDNWISSTVSSATKQLILVLYISSNLPPPPTDSELYNFPFKILVNQKCLNLEHLQLEYIIAKIPQNFCGFPALKTLKLNFVRFNQLDFLNMLNNCLMLESLQIDLCRDLVDLQVSSPLPRLKFLLIHSCGALKSIDLWAENLSTFEYDSAGFIKHLVVRESHNLTKVAAHSIMRINYDNFHPLSNGLPFVSTLYLHLHICCMSEVLTGSRFTHLRFLAIFLTGLEFERDIRNLSSLLDGFAPMLEELELHLRQVGVPASRFKGNKIQMIDGGSYNQLKRVAFTGFTGERTQTMLAKYFLRKARRLQVMTIDTKVRYYSNFNAVANRSRVKRDISKTCWDAYNYLCKEAPKDTKLILVDN